LPFLETEHSQTLSPVPVTQIAVIVVNYNTSRAVAELHQQITRLRNSEPSRMFFLVIDNASRSEEIAHLREYFAGRADAELLLSETNTGYARGNNLGLRWALERGFSHCLIANSDIEFLTSDFAERLILAAQTLPRCGLIGPRVVLPNGKPQGPLPETGVWNSVMPMTTAVHATTARVYATVGCCIFGATAVFARIGFLDETTFLYREEIALAEKLRHQDLNWYYLPDVLVRHNHARKLDSVKKVIRHKAFEAESTIHYFRHYKHRTEAVIFTYRVLLGIKTAIFVLFVAVRQACKGSA
jgi:GT2 family glycosyltransferase